MKLCPLSRVAELFRMEPQEEQQARPTVPITPVVFIEVEPSSDGGVVNPLAPQTDRNMAQIHPAAPGQSKFIILMGQWGILRGADL